MLARALQACGWVMDAPHQVAPVLRITWRTGAPTVWVAVARGASPIGAEVLGGLQPSTNFIVLADWGDPVWSCFDSSSRRWGDLHEFCYAPCCYASTNSREVRVVTNISGMQVLKGRCHHIHSGGEPKLAGPTAQEAVALALAMTKSLGDERVPLLEPAEVGFRMGVQGDDAQVTGPQALDALLFRYCGVGSLARGLAGRIPTSELAAWLRQRGALTPRGEMVSQVNEWRPDHLYVGRACPRLKLPASMWARPYVASGPRAQYSPAEAVAKYRELVLRSPVMLAQLSSLSGKVLLCHCRTDMPCHRDVLIELFIERCRRPLDQALVYAGSSDPVQRLRRTEWAITHVPGAHGTPEECAVAAIRGVAAPQRVRGARTKLCGKYMVCECPLGQACHVDMIHMGLCASDEDRVEDVVYIDHVAVPRAVMQKRIQAEDVSEREWSCAIARSITSLFPRDIAKQLKCPDLGKFCLQAPFAYYRAYLSKGGGRMFSALYRPS